MQVNIVGITGPQLSGLVATAGVGSVALKWDNPDSIYHKSTEVWAGTSSDVGSATKIGITTDYTYVVIDANPNQPMYYWVRSVSVFNRSDALFSLPVNKAGNAVTGTAAKMLSLGTSSQIFSVAKSGSVSPATINLYASAQNLQGTPTWSITSGTATLTASSNGNAYQQDLTYANMATDQVTIQISQDGMIDTMTIVKVRDGVDTITGMLTNEAANVAADFSGTVTSFANSGGSFRVFQGTVDKTSLATFSVVSPVNVTMNITAAGVYSVTALTADNGSATLRAVYGGVTIDKVYTIVKAKAGTNGTSGSPGSEGARGTVNLQGSGYAAWSDSAANTVISNAGYGSPQRGDIVTLYNSTFSATKFYSGGVWNTLTAYINGNLLVAGTLDAAKISTGIMTGQTIQTSTSTTKVIINENNTETLRTYYGGSKTVEIGGGGASGGIKITMAQGNAAGLDVTNTGNFAIIASGANGMSVSGSTHGMYLYGGTGNALNFSSNGSGLVQSGTATNILSHILPVSDNACVLGSSSSRWSQLYVASGVINSSDSRLKMDIVPSILGLDFINDLVPVSYRQIVGQNDVDVSYTEEGNLDTVVTKITPRSGLRRHYGFLAQDVRESLLKHGEDDTGIWCLDDPEDPDSRQALRYEELISPMIKAIQELKSLVDAQQKQIEALLARGT